MCEPECPIKAIYMGVDLYEINPTNCTQCVGHFDAPQCKEVCPVDCIRLGLDHPETQAELHLKFVRLTTLKAVAVATVAA